MIIFYLDMAQVIIIIKSAALMFSLVAKYYHSLMYISDYNYTSLTLYN